MEQIDPEVREHRAQLIMDIQGQVMAEFQEKTIGKTFEVLVEGEEDGYWFGRSQIDAPDVDTKVYFQDEASHIPGEYIQVEITGGDGYDLEGRPCR